MSRQETAAPAAMEQVLRVCVWVVLYALPLGVALLPLFDEDVWWHLRVGEWMLEHGRLPEADSFSRFGIESGKPWVVYSWLYEVLLAVLHRRLGDAGIILYRTLLTLAIVVSLHRLVAKREPRFFVAAGIMALGVFALLPLVTERPWLFTILFGTFTLDVVLDLRDGRRPVLMWLLPLGYVLWANLHIQFVYGLLLLGLALAASVTGCLLARQEGTDQDEARSWRLLLPLAAACFLATLVTPYHVGLYQVVLEYGGQRTPLKYIAEMQPLEFREAWDWALVALAGAGVFTIARRKQVPVFEVLLLAAAGWFAFRSRRDAWFLLLAALAALLSAKRPAAESRSFWPSLRPGLAFVLVVGFLCGYWWTTRVTPELMGRCQEQRYPVVAVEVIRQRGYPGPVYNSYNWGGYLMWKLPELPVAIDGRANLHGEGRILQSMTTWLGKPGWDHDPDLHAARLVVAEASSPLVSILERDPRFEAAYRDNTAVVFVARPLASGYSRR